MLPIQEEDLSEGVLEEGIWGWFGSSVPWLWPWLAIVDGAVCNATRARYVSDSVPISNAIGIFATQNPNGSSIA